MTKTPEPKPSRLRHLRPSDLRAAAQLATQATRGVIGITEGVHQSVLRTLGAAEGQLPGRTTGLTGQIYRSIHGVTRLVGRGLDAALEKFLPLLAPEDPAHPASPEREAVLSALNGVLGDRLVAQRNPLALAMALRQGGQALRLDGPAALRQQLPQASPNVLLLIHGLCMSDTQWLRGGHDHGAMLARELGCTPLYLRYNTGLHTSDNGRQLADLLEQLCAQWPVPLQGLTIVAHSMGGLVARSAHHAGVAAGHPWPGRLRQLVFLGTPHHGAPLERAGNWVDTLLGSTPYTAPFARLGQLRSAGITDLRWGHVLQADWQGRDRFHRASDSRVPLPLPEGVACYSVAATLAGQRGLLAERLMGDGLVPLDSALGRHDDPRRRLAFARGRQRIVYRTGHLDLLSSPDVARQLLQWLRPAAAEPG